MPRWLFLILVACLALSVVGGVLIVLRSPRDPPPAAATMGSAMDAPARTGGGP